MIRSQANLIRTTDFILETGSIHGPPLRPVFQILNNVLLEKKKGPAGTILSCAWGWEDPITISGDFERNDDEIPGHNGYIAVVIRRTSVEQPRIYFECCEFFSMGQLTCHNVTLLLLCTRMYQNCILSIPVYESPNPIAPN